MVDIHARGVEQEDPETGVDHGLEEDPDEGVDERTWLFPSHVTESKASRPGPLPGASV
jgi:hypothetical protein